MPKLDTAQEIFDFVKSHLLTQGRKSEIRDHNVTECMYRVYDHTTGEKLMCAAGCLIDDEHYDSAFEGKVVDNILVRDALDNSGINLDFIPLIGQLQGIHDGVPVEEWEEELTTLAECFNLTP